VSTDGDGVESPTAAMGSNESREAREASELLILGTGRGVADRRGWPLRPGVDAVGDASALSGSSAFAEPVRPLPVLGDAEETPEASSVPRAPRVWRAGEAAAVSVVADTEVSPVVADTEV
jgi:hypothetical protein